MVLLKIYTKLLDFENNTWHVREEDDLLYENVVYINPDKISLVNKCRGVDYYQVTIECGSSRHYIFVDEDGKTEIESWKAMKMQ